MACKKQESAKYATRKSPPYPANECCGETKKGNDGHDYIATKDKNGRCRWVLEKKGNTWYTHANGSKPYKVVENVATKEVTIYKVSKMDPSSYEKKVKEYQPSKVFVGKSPRNKTTEISKGYGKSFDGNSILLELKEGNKYVFVGHVTYEFKAPEPIEKYYSAVGNNDVPYPVAMSKNYTYFMLDAPRNYKDVSPYKIDIVEKSVFPAKMDWSDAYGWYYEHLYVGKGVEVPLGVRRLRVTVIDKGMD